MKAVQAKVTLVQHTADPEELVASAARLGKYGTVTYFGVAP